MANNIESLVAAVPIKSSPEKFYNFFKFNMDDLVKVFPAVYTGVQILQGEPDKVGCVRLWSYILEMIPLTVKVLTEAIDDLNKSITWSALEGDVLQLYKSFVLTLKVDEGMIQWTIEYERASLVTPPPELYIPVFVTAATLVDAYVLLNY